MNCSIASTALSTRLSIGCGANASTRLEIGRTKKNGAGRAGAVFRLIAPGDQYIRPPALGSGNDAKLNASPCFGANTTTIVPILTRP